MKNQESLLNEKFSKEKIALNHIYGGAAEETKGTGPCDGTGCHDATGKTDTTPGVIDWEDIECGDTNYPGSYKCPSA